MSNITHKNHYVPQSTLCRWSKDGTHVHAYRVLVSKSKVPEWQPRAISGIAFQPDLYTFFSGDEELDEFEHWIEKEFETPGLEAIDRLISQRRLSPTDWKAIASFIAAQDVRTPLNYILSMQRWQQEVPTIIEDSIQKSVKKLEAARLEGIKLTPSENKNEFSNLFRVHVNPPSDPMSDEASIQTGKKNGDILNFLARDRPMPSSPRLLSPLLPSDTRRPRWSKKVECPCFFGIGVTRCHARPNPARLVPPSRPVLEPVSPPPA